jgi:hypothetical protein
MADAELIIVFDLYVTDYTKDLFQLQVNQPIPCMGLTQWLEQRHIWL